MKYFIPYILLGAVFAGILDKEIVKDCKDHIPLEKIILFSTAYPILIIVSMITDSTGENVCEDMFNDTRTVNANHTTHANEDNPG